MGTKVGKNIVARRKLPPTVSIPQAETHSEEEKLDQTIIRVIDYGTSHYEEHKFSELEDIFTYRDSPNPTWINIDGPLQTEFLNTLGQHFHLHSLVLEDLRTEQRPKIENYGEYIYVVFRSLSFNPQTEDIENDQVSIIVGTNFLLSFQEKERNITLFVRERLRSVSSKARRHGTDYLFYLIIDAIVDNYFFVLEKIGEKLEELEEQLLAEPSKQDLKNIHKLRRDMIVMRKSTWPLREVISRILRGESTFISPNISVYLRDVYDHIIQVIDTVETFRDLISNILDIYLSNITQKTNEIMKTLAIAATIFAPLTFLTGIWGMNFKDMPDLNWQYGYPLALAVMLFVVLIMLVFFKKRKWL